MEIMYAQCSPELCPGGVVDPVDPDTGELIDVCGVLINPPANAVDVALIVDWVTPAPWS